MNRVVLAGRLTKDPELRYTQNGNAVTRFTVAVNRTFKNANGQYDADFVNCVAWRKQAENLANYMRKGSMVGVDGRIQTDSYDDQDGKRVFVTEVLAEQIHFLESKKNSSGNNPEKQDSSKGYPQNSQQTEQKSQQQTQQPNPFTDEAEPVDIGDDNLPF